MVQRVSKEADLGEVLAEVSLLDLGQVLKQMLSSAGCFAVFIAISALLSSTGSGWLGSSHLPGWSSWIFYVLILWAWLAAVTEHKSYHEISWYFPKLSWWASFLIATYFTGLIKLYSWHSEWWLWMATYFVYIVPFLVFLAVLEIGHSKLMEKRNRAAAATDVT